MEKIACVWILIFVMAFVQKAEAFVFVDTSELDFTGVNAARYHPTGYEPLSELTGNIGGFSSSDRLGEAAQFVLHDQTYLDKVVFDMDTYGRSIFFNDQINFDFIIYKGDSDNNGVSPYLYTGIFPDTKNEIYRSPVQLNFDPNGFYPDGSPIFTDTKSYTGLENKIDLTLEGGHYWLAYERAVVNGLPQGMGIGQFTFGEVNTAPVPEPATVFLLGSGLAGAIWRRRKVGKV